jgi:hypothetical protein
LCVQIKEPLIKGSKGFLKYRISNSWKRIMRVITEFQVLENDHEDHDRISILEKDHDRISNSWTRIISFKFDVVFIFYKTQYIGKKDLDT